MGLEKAARHTQNVRATASLNGRSIVQRDLASGSVTISLDTGRGIMVCVDKFFVLQRTEVQTRMSNHKDHAALDVIEAAKLIGVTPSALRKWKYLGEGPAYYRAGHLVRYQRDAVLRWIEAKTVQPHSLTSRRKL